VRERVRGARHTRYQQLRMNTRTRDAQKQKQRRKELHIACEYVLLLSLHTFSRFPHSEKLEEDDKQRGSVEDYNRLSLNQGLYYYFFGMAHRESK
jgi:hypothetical protein